VFFVNEPFTETRETRRIGRKIPRSVMLRVVRRDNNQCQTCGKVLKDDEIEFDHIIPVSKGGSSEEHNVRVACFDCNRTKSDNYEP
jgi:5-methylcytosine-specific restriction endonuclease McrA